MDNEFQNNNNKALTHIDDALIRDEHGRFLPSDKPTKTEVMRADKKMIKAMTCSDDFLVNYYDNDFQADMARISPRDRLEIFCKILNKRLPNNANVNLNDESRASSEREIIDRLTQLAGGFNGINE